MTDRFAIRFFQVSNEQVSARFLAKFLAIRFSQGFSVRSALAPIRRDLRLAKKLAYRLHLKQQQLKERIFKPAARGGGFSSLISLLRFSKPYITSQRFQAFSH